jgi:glyine---[glycyl-carrier protein] ligase
VTMSDEQRSGTVVHLVNWFEQQAAARPGVVALISGADRLTYRELDIRANRYAHQLRATGIGPEAVVGVCATPGLDTATIQLAIAKAGGVYLPLDPGNPDDRLHHMIHNVGTRLLVTSADLQPRLARLHPRLTTYPDLAAGAPDQPTTAPARHHHRQQAAYIVYTSGSTGTPKAITMTATTIATVVRWQLNRRRGSEVGIQLASIGFDVSLLEFWVTLLGGGRLVLPSDLERRDPDLLLDLLAQHQVHRVYSSPALFDQLAYAWTERRQRPRLTVTEFILAGEALRLTPAVRELLRHLDDVTLENQYGPSETHEATAHLLTGNPEHWDTHPHIGQPITDVHVYLLDSHLNPVPIGTTGEIYIAGPSLARGYANQPATTATRFLADPHTTTPGNRMYRTGDLARRTSNGNLEFLGRSDDQIKIRGHRIEPAEIENTLTSHPHINHAAVTGHTINGTKQLAAYITTTTTPPPTPQQIRDHLTKTLPDHMIPTTFTTLTTIPLTSNGKIDRKALPPPTTTTATPHTPPRTDPEKIIHTIWTTVLGNPTINTTDNFFTLGGHSLLATQITTRIRREFGIPLPLRAIFENPTITQLATAVEELVHAEIAGLSAEEVQELLAAERDT